MKKLKTSFVGPSYQARSPFFDIQRTVNLYPVPSEVGNSKSRWGLQGTPGLKSFLELPLSPSRNAIAVNDRVFVVSGNTLYEIFIDGTYTSRGTLNSQSGYVGIATNGLQVCIVDGPDGYIFTLATNVFAEITDSYFLGATTVTFIDGYFAFNKPDSGIYYLSALYDGSTGDPLDFATAEGSPDNLVAVIAFHQQLWLLGTNTIQIVTNTGEADFPFSTVQGSLIQYGCLAPYSVVVTGNQLFWLGRDADGQATVWKAEGYAPQKVSTDAVDFHLQGYNNLSNATAFSYQEDGQWFYILNFDQATWGYDIKNNVWHERAYFENGSYERALPNWHVFAYGKHLVGDYQSGMVYEQDLDFLDFAGTPIRRERIAPYIHTNLNYIYFKSFQLDMQVGVGLDGAAADADADPKMVLSWTDNGKEWSFEYEASMGRIGEYNTRVLWNRLGRGRQRVFKCWTTARVKQFWMDCYILAEEGHN